MVSTTHAAERAEPLEVVDGDAERGQEDDVVRGDPGEIELAIGPVAQEGDPHFLEPGVHVRIVDDLADQEDPPVGKLGPGFVGVLDRAIDAVAEAELARETEGERPDRRGCSRARGSGPRGGWRSPR